jgi:ubiquinone biosynthesis protein
VGALLVYDITDEQSFKRVQAWVQELRKLEDQVPPRPAAVVRQTILEETGREPEQIFSSFDQTPLGSASIGQVHRARLHNGRVVAVKVQYPGITATLDSDLRNLGAVLSMGRVFLSRERLDQFLATHAPARIWMNWPGCSM